MPFSNAPVNDTYSSHRVPIVYDFKLQPGATYFGNSGNTSVLSGADNVIPIKKEGSNDLYGISRPGLKTSSLTTTANTALRGMYVWEKFVNTNTYYFIVTTDGANTTVWSSANGTTWGSIHTWASTNTMPCRFTEFITDTNTKYLVLLTGDQGYVFTSSSPGAQITSANFPNPHIPFPVFMNGRIYVAKKNTGDIYNCALNDPFTWAAGDFISSEVYPDDVQALVKMDNYIAAIGATGTEYFYDAANATGSPLARYDGGLLPFGSVFPYTIANSRGAMTLLTRANDGGVSIKHIEGFKSKEISTEAISTLLVNYLSSSTGAGGRLLGNYLRMYGELYYMLTFDGTFGVGQSADNSAGLATMVYSFSTDTWCRFSYPSVQQKNQFPVTFVAPSNSTAGTMYVGGTTFSKVFFGTLAELNKTDDFAAIQQTLCIPPQSFETNNRKFMSRVSIGVECSVPSTTVSLLYSDIPASDSFTSAGNFGDLVDFPSITQLGSFRNRQLQITTTTALNTIKWNHLEFDINKGQQ